MSKGNAACCAQALKDENAAKHDEITSQYDTVAALLSKDDTISAILSKTQAMRKGQDSEQSTPSDIPHFFNKKILFEEDSMEGGLAPLPTFPEVEELTSPQGQKVPVVSSPEVVQMILKEVVPFDDDSPVHREAINGILDQIGKWEEQHKAAAGLAGKQKAAREGFCAVQAAFQDPATVPMTSAPGSLNA